MIIHHPSQPKSGNVHIMTKRYSNKNKRNKLLQEEKKQK